MSHLGRLVVIVCCCLFGATACAQVPAIFSAPADAPATAPPAAPAGASAPASAPAPAEVDAPPRAESLSRYRLSTGDVISIVVYGEDDLKREKVRLTDAGTISYPVLGEIQVRGKTVGELEELVAEGLRGRYLVNPRVSVTIDEYRPYFINGQIARAGSYPYQPGLTVRKAVTIAGGFRERASQSKIFVVRESDATHARTKVELDTPIYPGDIVTVEESFF